MGRAGVPANETEMRKASMSQVIEKRVVTELARCEIYCVFRRAFAEVTGLRLSLTASEDSQRAPQPQAGRDGQESPRAFAEPRQRSVPVRQGGRVIAYLRTAGRAVRRPAERDVAWRTGADGRGSTLKEADCSPHARRGLERRRDQAALRLLSIFSRHLGLLANGLVLQHARGDPPAIAQAREFIQAHQSEPLSFRTVARAVHMSPFHFCKQFKKNTGLNFTQYVCRCRVETAQRLLLNPHSRVSEVAIEVGFQSITHFNRVFKDIVGQSPSQYRVGRLRAA